MAQLSNFFFFFHRSFCNILYWTTFLNFCGLVFLVICIILLFLCNSLVNALHVSRKQIRYVSQSDQRSQLNMKYLQKWHLSNCENVQVQQILPSCCSRIIPNNLPYLSYVFGQTGLSKQFRPRWDAAEFGVSSGSTLFATHPAIFRHNIVLVQMLEHIWYGVEVSEYLG